jgi:hypothetical protein
MAMWGGASIITLINQGSYFGISPEESCSEAGCTTDAKLKRSRCACLRTSQTNYEIAHVCDARVNFREQHCQSLSTYLQQPRHCKVTLTGTTRSASGRSHGSLNLQGCTCPVTRSNHRSKDWSWSDKRSLLMLPNVFDLPGS